MKSVGDRDSIFQRRLHEISGSEEQEINSSQPPLKPRQSFIGKTTSNDHFKLC